MQKFTQHTGIAVPLQRSNVDTDQIIPAAYLKRISRTGFEDGLFSAWRGDPDFVLNQEPWRRGSILVVGPDFGTGSSREHAVWALQDHGFRVVIGSRFGDIFRSNASNSGLLVATVDEQTVEQLWQLELAEPGIATTVDLVTQRISRDDRDWHFEVDPHTRSRLLEGLDGIGATLRHADEITSFEATRPHWMARTLPV